MAHPAPRPGTAPPPWAELHFQNLVHIIIEHQPNDQEVFPSWLCDKFCQTGHPVPSVDGFAT